jgi:hypothetical protein
MPDAIKQKGQLFGAVLFYWPVFYSYLRLMVTYPVLMKVSSLLYTENL